MLSEERCRTCHIQLGMMMHYTVPQLLCSPLHSHVQSDTSLHLISKLPAASANAHPKSPVPLTQLIIFQVLAVVFFLLYNSSLTRGIQQIKIEKAFCTNSKVLHFVS